MELFCRTRRRKIVSWFCCISVFIAASLAAVFTIAVLFKPRELQVSISDASLSQFSFSDNNTDNTLSLSYSLSLSVSLRNPNRRGAAVIYERVRISAFYGGAEVAAKNLSFPDDAPLRQAKRNTAVLHVELRGRADGFSGGGDVAAYDAETLAGEYSLEVRVVMRVRAKYGGGVESRFFEAPEILCGGLKVPLVKVNGSGLPAVKFKATRCKNVFIFKTRDTVKHQTGYF